MQDQEDKKYAKTMLRVRLESIRNQITKTEANKACMKFDTNFKKFLQLYPPKKPDFSIAGFYSIKSEINILFSLHSMELLGHVISLPSISKEDKTLIFRQWSYYAPTTIHPKFFFPEPHITATPITPDIILVPLLGFDKFGARIGYGHGYYDRTLSSPLYQDAVKIGCAFAAQELKQSTLEPSDVLLDFVITEQKIIDCNANRKSKKFE